MNTQKWKEFCTQSKTEVKSVPVDQLIVYKGSWHAGVLATYTDILEGRKNTTNDPIKVCWIREENKFLVLDGYHRFIQALLEGRAECMCEIDW